MKTLFVTTMILFSAAILLAGAADPTGLWRMDVRGDNRFQIDLNLVPLECDRPCMDKVRGFDNFGRHYVGYVHGRHVLMIQTTTADNPVFVFEWNYIQPRHQPNCIVFYAGCGVLSSKIQGLRVGRIER